MVADHLLCRALLFLSVSVAFSGARHPAVRREDTSTSGRIAAAWYAGWHAEDFPLSAISWSKYTILTYAFATTTPEADTISLESSDDVLLSKFVTQAHQNNVKASLSIGGWTGSRFFSSNVGSAANRTSFVRAVTNIARKYSLDGIDFDWEYPHRQGIGCNEINDNDTSNFLSFLQELRQHPLGANLTLSAATSIIPYTDSNGDLADIKPFGEVLDYIAIMNYDVWGSWSTGVGPNAPLNDSCADTEDQDGSAVGAVQAWTAAGMPASQIVLGVPSYGHSFAVSPGNAFEGGSKPTLKLFPQFDATDQPHGDRWDGGAGTDICGNSVPTGGVFTFWGLVDNDFLNADGSAKNGIASVYDECSQTPYVYNSTSGIMVSYDDSRSFAAKGAFIKSNGLAGFAMWEAGGDSSDILVDSIRSAIATGNASNSEGSLGVPRGTPRPASSSSYARRPELFGSVVILLPILLYLSVI